MNQEQETPTLVWNDGVYKISDLREDALEVLNRFKDNRALAAHHRATLQQLEIASHALSDKLNRALVGVKHEKLESKPSPVDLTEGL